MRVFKSRLIRNLLSSAELNDLVNDFRSYKNTGVVPENFGRDVPYDHPHTMPMENQNTFNIFTWAVMKNLSR